MADRRIWAAGCGLLGVLLAAALQPVLWGGIGGLLDYYPLYHGAHAWLETGDAYWRDPSLPDVGQLSSVGNSYPIHATLLLGLPLAWLPPVAAGPVWVLLVGVAWVAAIGWARESWYWLLWWPMWDALRIQQASAAVTVASIVALGALRRGSRLAFLIAMPIMAVKPQQTGLLMLALIWCGRRWWRSMAVVWGLILIACFVAQPGWLSGWLDRVAVRSDVVQGEQWLWFGLIPLGIFLMYRGWRVSGVAVISSGLGPWPVSGPYVASVWPLGLEHERFAVAGLVSLVGLVPLLLDVNYWCFPVILSVGLAFAAAVMPRAPAAGKFDDESRKPQPSGWAG